MSNKEKLMFIVLPSWDMPHLTGLISNSLNAHTSSICVIKSRDEYFACADRHTYTVIAVWGLPGFSKEVINDQMENNKVLKWVHSLSVGVDEHCSIKKFRESPMPLTNARGAFSHVLGEYILFGILYFAKKAQFFQESKQKVRW